MKILSLCFCNDYWPDHQNDLIDVKNGKNVLDQGSDIGKNYDLILAAPPCDLFTKASSHMWKRNNDQYNEALILFTIIAGHCLRICIESGRPWVLENPPGRIQYFVPELIQYRRLTYQDRDSNKEYVLYSNVLLTQNFIPRYGKLCRPNCNLTKNQREKWTPELVDLIKNNFNL